MLLFLYGTVRRHLLGENQETHRMPQLPTFLLCLDRFMMRSKVVQCSGERTGQLA